MSGLGIDPTWLSIRQRGRCFDDPQLRTVMFPETSGKLGSIKSTADYHAKYDLARAICEACQIATECLEYALAAKEPFGMWGGLDPIERHHLVRPQQRKVS